jgi:hypothetical protein
VTAGLVRFVLEAAFIVVVAVICWAVDLSWRGIAPAMAGAWLLVTFVERSATQDHSNLRNGKYGFLFRHRQADDAARDEPESEPASAVAPPPSHVTVLEPAPSAEHPPTPTPPEPAPPTPEPAPPVPEPEPTPEPGEPVPQLELVPEPGREPEPEDEPEPSAPEPVAAVTYLQPRVDGAATREWNVWELERIAREIEGRDPARDEELAFLLIELRQFANADGQLAPSFDPVVRDSFGDLLYTPA